VTTLRYPGSPNVVAAKTLSNSVSSLRISALRLDVEAFVIQSYEAQLIQVCDLLIGAVSYKNRTDIEHSSEIKQKVVNYLQQKLGYPLNINTPPWEAKFNIFRFMPRVC
tara:strand:- start:30 stop:356 length:327 start_codon:yes stop_codon:yes gene_type:complete